MGTGLGVRWILDGRLTTSGLDGLAAWHFIYKTTNYMGIGGCMVLVIPIMVRLFTVICRYGKERISFSHGIRPSVSACPQALFINSRGGIGLGSGDWAACAGPLAVADAMPFFFIDKHA